MSCWCKWRILQKKKSKSGEQKWRVTFMRWSDFIFIWGFAVRKIEGSPDCSEPIKSRIPSIWLSGHLGAKVTCRHQWPPGAARALSFVIWVVSAFYSTKIQDWNFGNFTLWMEWCYQLNLSDPSHCMFCSKSSSRDSNFVKWKGAMKWPDWSKWTTFNCGRKYSGRTGHKWSVPFDLQEKFPLFWVEWKTPIAMFVPPHDN